MKKYKLINKKTNEEYICDKITEYGFDYYINDDKINKGDWFYDSKCKSPIKTTGISKVETLIGVNGIKKLIASNNHEWFELGIHRVLYEVEEKIYFE